MFKGLLSVLLVIAGLGAAHAETSGALSSPMVDRSIYKPGAVTRLSGRFDDWTVTCDEISALKQRFCSMRSLAGRDAYGHTVRIDVSTGDDGKPAALLHLPLLISVASGLDIRTGPGKRAPAGAAHRHLSIATCTATECLAVWSIDQSALHALLAGLPVDLVYCSLRPGGLEFAADLHKRSCEARLVSILSGTGFRAAVAAATRP